MPNSSFESEGIPCESTRQCDSTLDRRTPEGRLNRRTWLKLTGILALFGGLVGWSGQRVRLDGVHGVGVDGTALALGAETVSLGDLPTLSRTVAGGQGNGAQAETIGGVEAYTFDAAVNQPLGLEIAGDVAVAVYDTTGGLLDMASPVADGSLTIPASASGTHVAQIVGTGATAGPYALALAASSSTTTVPVEAETAEGDDNFSPLEVRTTDAASGQEYIVAPDEGRERDDGPPSDGRVTYAIDLPADGDYSVWARANGQEAGRSFYGRLDNGPWHEVHFDVDDWNWRKLGDTGGNDQKGGETFPLSGGTHSLELAYREDGCKLDKLVVTNDAELTPTGRGPTDDNTEPNASLSVDPTSVETGTVVEFDGSESSDPDGVIESYEWGFGDDTADTGESVTHSYDSLGEYAVTLTVTDDGGATDTATRPVVVSAPVTADAGDNRSVVGSTSVTLDASGSSGPDGDTLSYTWTQTGGPPVSLSDASVQQPTFSAPTVSERTTLTFRVNVSSAQMSATDSVDVTVRSAPEPVGSLDNAPTDPDEDGKFEDVNGDGSINIGDAQALFSNIRSPTIQNNTDTFDFNDNGNVGTGDAQTLLDIATTRPAPTPDPEPIGPLDTAPRDPDGDGKFEDINGDGSVNSGDGQTLFNNVGDPAVQNNPDAFDFNDDGEVDTNDIQTLLTDDLTTNATPVASLSASSTTAQTGTVVEFDGSESSDPDGVVESYEWAFGDDTAATGESVTHRYDSPGGYTVTLTVTDDEGATGTASTTVSVTSEQAPYTGTARDVTDTVEAERFDTGGQGVAYSDTDTANRGGEFRPDEAVDIGSHAGGYDVSRLRDGEWLEYTVDIPAEGSYNVVARTTSTGGGTLRVTLDGRTLGTIEIPVTGGGTTWTTASLSGVSVDAGSSRLLRLDVVDSGFDLDWIVFEPADNSPPTAATGPDRTATVSGDSGPGIVTLDGSRSSDPDGTITSYSWRENGAEIATGETTDVSLATGAHEITLVVTDDDDATDDDTTSIVVSDTVAGTPKEWHKVILEFDGPDTSETADPNPFLDYRLDVTFEGPSAQTYEVPGYYAADGAAADTGATSGSTWRANLAPDEAGEWSYEVSFVRGSQVAVGGGGRSTDFDGTEGAFLVAPSNKSGRDFRARGALQAVGDHYLQFAGGDEYFLKNGTDSSENFLGYAEFDQTYPISSRPQSGLDSFIHEYEPHVDDWSEGDPTWRDERGKGVVGAVNYLASEGVNSHYFLTYNVDGGDGSDVWPWTGPDERLRFDVSKLAQWERLFEHMTRKGVMLHVVTQETENDQSLDGGSLGVERTLYYRELIARFGHHPAITWNLGEENTNSDAQRSAFTEFFEETDPYDSFVCVHTYPGSKEGVYGDLLGRDDFDGTSLQTSYSPREAVLEWRRRSAQAGRPWVVMVDETGSPSCGIPADGNSCVVTQDEARRDTLWGSLMAGAGGVEWFFGYESVGGDLGLEDYRSRDQWWDYSRYAHDLLTDLPLPEMAPSDGRLANTGAEAHCLVHEDDDVAVVYLHQARPFDIQLSGASYALRWLDPETGEETDAGEVDGSGVFAVGAPPFDGDAVAVLERP